MVLNGKRPPTWNAMNLSTCVVYLRLSDGRVEEAFEGREARLRAEAARIGWIVWAVVIENDILPDGKLKPASAFLKRKVVTPSGNTELRVIRDKFRNIVLPAILSGRNLLCEDLDRVARDHRDLADILDAVKIAGVSARSLSGSLTLTRGGTDAEISQAWNLVNFKNMESRDKSRRVSEHRQRFAGLSYAGGRRPFGYRVDESTEKYHRMLVIDEVEAAILRKAADDILNRGISLHAVARELRDNRVPTVKDTAWTTASVRDALMKPTVAGLAVKWVEDDSGDKVRTLIPACWPAILDRETWDRLNDFLTDPARVTTTSNEPRWLLSLHAKCECGANVRVSGPVRDKRYQCSYSRHMSKSASQVERYVTSLIIARLSLPDVKDLLKPPPRRGTDVPKLRADARKLRERKTAQLRRYDNLLIDDADLDRSLRQINQQLALIETVLAESDVPDSLAEFRNKPADSVWNSLSIARRRAVVKILMDVCLVRCKHTGPVFNPDGVQITWKVPVPEGF